MALVVKDRVKESTTTTGTGTVTLAGAATGFQAFSAALSDGDTTYYAIVESSTGAWEVGLGTWATGSSTLARTTVLDSSNAGSAINLSGDGADVFITQPADKAVYFDASGDVVLNQDPTAALQAATKQYVDSIAAAGIHYHLPVRVEKENNLNATYDNGTAGVGATLTNAGTQEALVIDGITMVVDDRVLVYEQTDASQNGIYTVTNVGSGSTNWVLTRATDADSYAPSDPDSLGQGDAFFVQEGVAGAGETYVMNTEGTITFGTTDITFVQFSSAQIYSAGDGLTLTGVTFAAGAGTGVTVNANDIAIGQDVGTSADVTFNTVTADLTGDVTGAVTGNASTASALQTARNIALTGAVTGSTSFDGSGNVSITTTATSDPTITLGGDLSGSATLTNLGNATLTATINANSVALGTDTTGNYVASGATSGNGISGSASSEGGAFTVTSNATNANTGSTIVFRDASGNFSAGTITAALSGNASTATSAAALTTARNIALSGDVTGNTNFDGSGNVSITTTIAANSVALGTDTTGNYVAGATGGTGITVSGSAGEGWSPTVSLTAAGAGSGTYGSTANGTKIDTITLDAYGRVTAVATGATGDIEGVTAGSGLTGGGSSGSVTLNVGAGTGVTVSADTVSIGQAVGTGNSPSFAGLNINGNINAVDDIYLADQIIHEGDTDTYMQFHAANQWRVVTGGVERLEVNDSNVTVNSALKEDYDALSGTTPTIDVDAGGGFSLTTSGNTTFTFSSFTSGVSCGFVLQLTAGGTHTITWPASVDWAGGTAPDAPASGATNIYVFWSRDGGTTWYGVLSSAAAA